MTDLGIYDDTAPDLFGDMTVANDGQVNLDIPSLRFNRKKRKASEAYLAEAAELEKLDEMWTPGEQFTLVTYRHFSVYRALIYWARKYGPHDMIAATWAMSETCAIEFLQAIDDGFIKSVALLVDFHTFQNRAEGIGCLTGRGAEVGVTKQHAKVSVLAGGKRPLMLISTANMNENQRIEVTIMSDDPDDVAFHSKWMREEIERTRTLIKPGGLLDGKKWRFNKKHTALK